MAVFTRFSGGFCILLVCVAPAAPPPLWAVPGPPVHEKRTPTAADAHDLKIVVKLRAVPTSKVPFPVEIAGFPDFSRPVPVYPAFLKYVVPVHLLRAFLTGVRLVPNSSASSCSFSRVPGRMRSWIISSLNSSKIAFSKTRKGFCSSFLSKASFRFINITLLCKFLFLSYHKMIRKQNGQFCTNIDTIPRSDAGFGINFETIIFFRLK